jgi:dCMP deaminase
MTKWDKRFLDMAKEVASWSKDPSRQIGAIAVDDDRRILSQGYNGFPRGIADVDSRLQDREVKYKYVVHAEKNVIYNATYHGVSLAGSTVYVHGLPVCSECAKGLIQVGVKRVVMGIPLSFDDNNVWMKSFEDTKKMFNEVGVDFEICELNHF